MTARLENTPLFALALLAFVAAAQPAAAETKPAWRPEASEKLVKLPPNYLKKAIDRDFADSELAQALRDADGRVGLKVQTLGDLKTAIGRAEGEVLTELRHQFLAEKREYLRLMGEQQELRRQQAKTKLKVFEDLLARVDRDKGPLTPAQVELLDRQKEAERRFQSSVAQIDMKLFGQTTAPESRYSAEYSKNLAAIEQLVHAVNNHPMNAQPTLDGQPVDRKEYLRQLVAESQSEIALLDQETTILGYMAKLVALDATALAESVDLAEEDGAEEGAPAGITAAVRLFVEN